MDMNDFGKILVFAGVALVIIGAILWLGFGRGWLGRLPGDIHYTKGNFSFYFPVVTCLILSILITVILRLLKK